MNWVAQTGSSALGIQEITLKSVSLGESGLLFKKLINSNWLAFTRQLENVMKRVTRGGNSIPELGIEPVSTTGNRVVFVQHEVFGFCCKPITLVR